MGNDLPKIVWKKLNRAWGYADAEKNTIWLDPRLDDATMADTGIHEGLHILCPYMDETEVVRVSGGLASLIIRLGFRRIETIEGDDE